MWSRFFVFLTSMMFEKTVFFFIFSVISVYCIQNDLKPTVGQLFADDNS